MSNETFEQLYKKFTGMINSFIKKYRGLLENDEIHQCCCLAIMKAYNTYNNHKDMKLSNWIYQNMEWQILRELSKENKHKNIISVNSTIESSEGSIIEILDMIQDKVNIALEVQDKIMMETYKAEITANLDKKKADVMILKYFYNQNNNYIEKVLNITGISNYVRESRMTLVRKSLLFRNEYRRIHHIDDYSHTERLALLDS